MNNHDQILPYLPTLQLNDLQNDGLYPFLLRISDQLIIAKSLTTTLKYSSDTFTTLSLSQYPLVLVKDRGQFYAFYDECPHRRIPLSSQGYLDTERNFIVCGFHRWGFHLNTGKHMIPTGNCIKTYATKIDYNYLWVQLK